MSRYGKQVLSEIIPKLVVAGYTIVSGVMYGIDQEAHKLTLEYGGKAVGVLGWGIDYDCEEGATKLEEKIVESGGLVLSEYPPGSRSQRFYFPRRNRIVVGLCEAVFIIEAGEKSGSLNTAEWAKKMGKKIYGVPGSMFSTTSMGINRLIASGEATLLTMREIEAMGGGAVENSHLVGKNGHKLSDGGSEISIVLRLEGPQSANYLARKMEKSVGDILGELMQLSMQGMVMEERGVWKVV
jgi:DNA processing protein